jgi:hypothetical protein
LLIAIAALGTAALGLSVPSAGASGGITVPPTTDPAPVDPAPVVTPKRSEILKVARRELRRKVRERVRRGRGDNVPRYRFGKGRIAPYNIGDQWCAAFATWTWAQVGFTDFRNPVKRTNGRVFNPLSGTLWRAQDKSLVAVQVRALRSWAQATNRRTFRATPGDLIAYGDNHIGIVVRVNRERRTIRTIEGNYKDGLRARTIPMSNTIDYFTPAPLPLKKQVTSARSVAADIEFDRNSPYRPPITPVDPSTLVE